MNTKSSRRIENIILKIAKYHWVLIGIVLCLLVGLETTEFVLGISDTFHIVEAIIYAVLLGIVGLLIEMVLYANRIQKNTMKILAYKHEISLALMPYQNWDSLVNLLVKRLAEIVDAGAVHLSLLDTPSNILDTIAEWTETDWTIDSSQTDFCQTCIDRMHSDFFTPHYCEFSPGQTVKSESRSYCFPILYKDSPYALIRFVLKPGRIITDYQQQILLNISDEIIIALMAGMDRKRLSELELAEAALAERHTMSHYLHDNLGQNLGYLRMKLEQFINYPELFATRDDSMDELKRMKDVVEQSYQIVRNKLEVSIPDSTPLLTNYLQEHAKKVAQRSKIEVEFASVGVARPISVELQRALFYVFQEALSNAERHARANKVESLLKWDEDRVTISVTDNGIGFRVQDVSSNKHFGLQIMRERMTSVGGTVEILSSEESGTSVKINAPIPFNKEKTAAHG